MKTLKRISIIVIAILCFNSCTTLAVLKANESEEVNVNIYQNKREKTITINPDDKTITTTITKVKSF